MIQDQQEIDYADIKELGFKEKECHDNVFFNRYGYPYKIITLKLAKGIYIEWDQVTRFCELVRHGKKGVIKGRMPLEGLNKVKELVEFFSDEEYQGNYIA